MINPKTSRPAGTSPEQARPARSSKGEQRRAGIVTLARAMLVEAGPDAFVLREVAKRAGIRLGNLQYYFATREALLATVVEAEAAEDLEVLRGAVAARAAPEAQLQAFCHAIIDRWLGESGRVFVALLALAQQNPLFAALHAQVYRNFHAALEPILRGLDAQAPPNEIATRAMLVTALIDGIAGAVAGSPGLDAQALADWAGFRRSHALSGSCTVGHTDLLALPL
jgi:AcrR family transcriptional regulator